MFLDNSIVLSHSDKVRILSEIKSLVKENKFEINLNTSSREENSYFVFQYDLEDKEVQKNILLNLRVEEFKDSGYSKNPRYTGEILHLFKHKLKDKNISMYIKLTYSKIIVDVISFHEWR